MVIGTLLALLPLAVIVHRGVTAVDRDDLEHFASAHGLDVTPGNGRLVMHYLVKGRYYRTIGASFGYLLAVFIGFMEGSQFPLIGLVLGLTGYFAGAFATEVALARARASGPSAASLVPRRVEDYVDNWATRWPWELAAASAVVLVVHVLAGGDDLVALSAVLAATVTFIAVIVVSSLRYVARRPQPVEDDDLLAADEAIRSASMHMLAAVGLGIACLVVAMQLWLLAASTGGWTAGIAWLLGVVLVGCAIGAWRDLPHSRFRVRRLTATAQ
jgi:hypothetical protein